MTTTRVRLLAFAALCASRVAAAAGAPSLPLPVETGKVESVQLGEAREFWVSLPDGYRDGAQRYPVVYMMDGEINFNSGCIGGLRLAAQMGEIPELIVVGIRNTDRSRDIFPEVVVYPDGSQDGGRADKFLDFIRDELIPRVEATYRTAGYRVLYGTSNTGYTAVYALFRSPSLADAYVAASATLSIPSFREKREALVKEFKGGRRRLALVMGERDLPTVISHNGILKELIDTSAPPGLSCRLAVLRGEEHVPPNSLVEGLRAVFEGWKAAARLDDEALAALRARMEGSPAPVADRP